MSSATIAMVAGEASGDMLATHLMTALRRQRPDLRFVGIGGPKMQAAGFDAWWPAEKLAVMGYAEVLKHYREITGIRRRLLNRLLQERPAVFIGVDAPDFNLWLERRLKDKGIPTVHYVSPTVWAWRAERLPKIAKAVSHMLALYPFEPEIYRKQGVPVTYVGHPLADVVPPQVNRTEVRERLDLPVDALVFALLPGSRQTELQNLGELYVETAKRLHQRFPSARFLVPLVSRETRILFEEAMWRLNAQELPFTLMFGHAQDALLAADCALVASGTATLEAALTKTPMVITYRMSPWSWRLMNRKRYQPWVGQPNILAGRFLVPEILQDDATPDNLSQALANLATNTEVKHRVIRAFEQIHRTLRQNSAAKAASAVLGFLPGPT